MARSTLSVFVAVASASYVIAQSSSLPTFPVTPLALLNFSYPTGLVCLGLVEILLSSRLTCSALPSCPG
jgi:hypothetical protein